MYQEDSEEVTFKMKPKIMRKELHLIQLVEQMTGTKALRQEELLPAGTKCQYKVAIVIEKIRIYVLT